MLDDDEIARLHALAEVDDRPIAAMLRAWAAERYAAVFGRAVPPTPRLRPGRKPRGAKTHP